MRLGINKAVMAVVAAGVLVVAGCAAPAPPTPAGGPLVVVTHAVLGAVVRELVGDRVAVAVLMGNGVDPHDWSPSARDIERLEKADLVVANGLGLEESLARPLEEAARKGVPVFLATDHVAVRVLGDGDEGSPDPHFWVDPIAVRDMVAALATELGAIGIDVVDGAVAFEQRLLDLDRATRATLAPIPEERRRLVTGHESMGYFADRYGFTLVGAVIPGLTSQGEVSAGELAGLTAEIRAQGVTAIFTEIGTPTAVVEAIGREAGVAVVPLPTHTLPDDGSYTTFIGQIADAIAGALQ